MKKTYMIRYTADFANTFELAWTTGKIPQHLIDKGWRRISRVDALRKIKDYADDDYAAHSVMPFGYPTCFKDIRTDKHYHLVNHIWEWDGI